jgi:hypothetical protein
MKNQLTLSAFSVLLLIGLGACKSDSTSSTPRTGTITQADLDNAKIASTAGIVGDPFNAFGTDTATTKHKLRDLFSSISNTTSVAEGDIFVRKAYWIASTASPNRDSILNFVVMIKRESGYYPQGGDWEYIKIPYDKTVDYNQHPYGLLPTDTSKSTLPDSTKTNLRGRLQIQCANCHTGTGPGPGVPGSDNLFSR